MKLQVTTENPMKENDQKSNEEIDALFENLRNHDELLKTDSDIDFNDTVAAKRFVQRPYEGALNFIAETKEWIKFDQEKKRHSKISERTLKVLVSVAVEQESDKLSEAIRELREELREATSENATKAIEAQIKILGLRKKELRKYLNVRNIKSAIEMAEDAMSISNHQINGTLDMLKVPNGLVNLRTSELITDESFIQSKIETNQSSVPFDKTKKAPKFQAFLMKITGGDEELIKYLQVFGGLCLTGETRDQQFYILFGPGANGKGVFVYQLNHVLGEYATTIKTETIFESKHGKSGDGANPEMVKTVGKRAVFTSEGKKNAQLDQSSIKNFTGEDVISLRALYGNSFDTNPLFKLLIETNYLPCIREHDNGTWRRIVVIPFLQTIEKSEMIKGYKQALFEEEKEGILAFFVEGARLYYENNGLPPCQIVEEYTASYRQNSDPIRSFMEKVTVKCPPEQYQKVAADDLYNYYKCHCDEESITPVNQKVFGTALKELEYDKKRITTGMTYLNIRFTQDAVDNYHLYLTATAGNYDEILELVNERSQR